MPPEVRAVWQVTRYLRELVEHDRQLADLWIGGEVSNLTVASSGHIYFTLKDSGGQIRCVFFRKQNLGQRDRLEAGASLIVHGAVSVYEARGEVQFVVDFVQAAGVGALQAEFERRKARFEAEGLFLPDRKRPLPRFPRRIGVVTSARGAAYHDIQTVLERRWPLAELVFQPTPVQGDEAPVAIAEAVRSIAPHDAPEVWPDVVIVGRGGGSAEDLWAFNEEPVIRAIFGCPVPVVSAVGHETDLSLADLVADVRAPTPSAAAEIVAPDRLEVLGAIRQMEMRQHVRLTRAVADSREQVDRRLARVERGLPDVGGKRHHLATHVEVMRRAATAATSQARQDCAALSNRLRALSPLATLDRGYVLVTRSDGSAVARASALVPGEAIEVRWRDGSHAARVESRG
ncbi:MAG: exodeoxyribonuclease VII large subunit [Dehalococcoidia bacterium]|nr:exodeoxyribonuclease VII large subunit [Dehalococcoidia bacterium]